MKKVNIGILGVQGDVEEHIASVESAFREITMDGIVSVIKYPEEINSINGLIIPGGESTSIGKLSNNDDFHSSIKKKITQGMPVLGTCAGLIFLSNHIIQNSSNTSQKLLGSLDIEIERNAFGRQRESFQSEFPIPKFGLDNFLGVFIRAPVIRNIGSNVEVIAKLDEDVIAVKQGNILATCFHPELSNNAIFHKYLIELVRETL
jgi:5'-phosphate synthase pdxT subunit|tara:strand:+ start:3812 stop:4426 length:615 start_codon:yes stop_codon:yes gene_type:complete